MTTPITIFGTPFEDRLRGGLGDDRIVLGTKADTSDYTYDEVAGSPGDDVIDLSQVGPMTFVQLDYAEIGGGLTFDVRGPANSGTIQGPGFTDTLVDPRRAMLADGLGSPARSSTMSSPWSTRRAAGFPCRATRAMTPIT